MVSIDDLADAQTLSGKRLMLEPLRPEHADELAPLLDDSGLCVFIGGEPATRDALRRRYERQVVGRSPDGSQRWFNWVVRRLGQVVGTTQATVTVEEGRLVAEVAWVVGTLHQHHGYAKEAAHTMVHWLRDAGVTVVVAHVHPLHEASAAVARTVGLAPTDVLVDGEVCWQTPYLD